MAAVEICVNHFPIVLRLYVMLTWPVVMIIVVVRVVGRLVMMMMIVKTLLMVVILVSTHSG